MEAALQEAASGEPTAEVEGNACTQEEVVQRLEQEMVEVDESQVQMESALQEAASGELTAEVEGNTCTQEEVLQRPEQEAVEVDESQVQMEAALQEAASGEPTAEVEGNACTQEEVVQRLEQEMVEVDESQVQMESALQEAASGELTAEVEGNTCTQEEEAQRPEQKAVEVEESQEQMEAALKVAESEHGVKMGEDVAKHYRKDLVVEVAESQMEMESGADWQRLPEQAHQDPPTDADTEEEEEQQDDGEEKDSSTAPHDRRRISIISVPDDEEGYVEQSQMHVQNEERRPETGEEEEEEDKEEKHATGQRKLLGQVKVEEDEEEQQEGEQAQQREEEEQEQEEDEEEQEEDEEEEDDDERVEMQPRGVPAFAPEQRQLHEPSTPARKTALQAMSSACGRALPAVGAHLEETPVAAAALPAVTFIADSLPSPRFEETPVQPRLSLPPLCLATEIASACPQEHLKPPVGLRASLPSVSWAPNAPATAGARPQEHLGVELHAPLPGVPLASDACPSEGAGPEENLKPPAAAVLELDADTQQTNMIHQEACSPPVAALPQPDDDQDRQSRDAESKLAPPPLTAVAVVEDNGGANRVSVTSVDNEEEDVKEKAQQPKKTAHDAEGVNRVSVTSVDREEEDVKEKAPQPKKTSHSSSCSSRKRLATQVSEEKKAKRKPGDEKSSGETALASDAVPNAEMPSQRESVETAVSQLTCATCGGEYAGRMAKRDDSECGLNGCSIRYREWMYGCVGCHQRVCKACMRGIRSGSGQMHQASSSALASEPAVKLNAAALELHNRQLETQGVAQQGSNPEVPAEAAPVEEAKGTHQEEDVAMHETATAGATQAEVEPQCELQFTQESQDVEVVAETTSTPLSKRGGMSRDEQNKIITSMHARHLFKNFNPAWMKTKRREPSTPSLGSAYIQEHILSRKDITATPPGNTRTSVLSLKAPQVRKLQPPASWEVSADAAGSGACASESYLDTVGREPQALAAPLRENVVACGSSVGQWKRGTAAVSHGTKLSDLLPSPVKRKASSTATDKSMKMSSFGSNYSDQQGMELKASPVQPVRHKTLQGTAEVRPMPAASTGPDHTLQPSQPEPEPMVTKGPRFVPTALEINARLQGIVKDLGGTFGNEWSDDVTHLVANTFRRTTKMMMAICKGIHVVTPEFLSQSGKAGKFLSEADYVLKDNVCEHCFAKKRGLSNYTLQDALVRARQNGPLLKGISVYLFPSSQEQTRREIESVVKAAGGTWLSRFPKNADDPSILLIGERVKCDKMKERRNQHKVYDIELLQEAALTQKLRKNMYLLQTPAEEEAKERQQMGSSAK